MASFGHLAVGMLAGQLHGAAAIHHPRKRRYLAVALFAALSVLPDADLILVACGAHDSGAIGHRGASHSLFTALAIGLACGWLARRMNLPTVRTAVAVTIAVGSHALLDVIGEGGRGIPLLWPLSEQRFMSPWRVLPDAPRVEALFCRHGMVSVVSEFLYFLPLMAYVLWPRRPAAPTLTLVSGGRSAADPAPVAASVAAPVAISADDSGAQSAPGFSQESPALRSSG
jgi:inner membrane protein